MKHSKIISILIAVTMLCITGVLAQLAGPSTFDLTWNTVDSGGGTSTGGNYGLSGTIGQPDGSTTVLTGGAYSLSGGFWPGVAPAVNTCPADITHNGTVNVDDLLAVINAWGGCPLPPTACPADIAPPGGNGMVSVDDLLVVINAWGSCP